MRIGIDLGGSKIEIIVLRHDGRVAVQRRRGTPRDDYAGTIGAIRDLVLGVEQHLGRQGLSLGVAMPGTMSPATGLVKNANSTWLNGRPLDRDLCAALDRPVRLANDANCFALSEWTDGAGSGCRSLFGVIIGTGTGGGLVVNGGLHAGPNLIAGEWGHTALPWPERDEWPGPDCYCGRHGCVETFLSGPALGRQFQAASGREATAEEVADAAAAGDADAERVLSDYERRLAKALATVVNIVDPEIVVLGGGLSNIERLYRHVPALLRAHAFSDGLSTRLVPARHGDASGARGAARLWPAADQADGG